MFGSLFRITPVTVLVLGWSSLARRRIVPALAGLGHTVVDIASLTRRPEWPAGTHGRFFDSYDEALRASDASVVYVSTRNHDHHRLVVEALTSDRHVIVDKPAALNVADVGEAIALAARRRRLVAEATVYAWHPQFAAVRELVAANGPVTRLSATFSFPPLPATNFRLTPEWGGGAIWDLGPYAVTPGRLFFGEAPDSLAVFAEQPAHSPVETAFSVLARYPGGRQMVGHYGTTTAYVNRLEVLGPQLSITMDRAFTTTPLNGCRVWGTASLRPVELDIPPADTFALFLTDVFDAIAADDLDRFAAAMATDAQLLDQLRNSRS